MTTIVERGFELAASKPRKEGLERLWDAFERMKTLIDPTDKARSVAQVLDLTAQEPQ